MRTILSLAICLVLFNACQKDNASSVVAAQDFAQVDARLAPYFERFVNEGARRGIEVDFDRLQVHAQIQEIDSPGVGGVCHYSSAAPNRIQIDASFFNSASDLFREFIIFHELGHCYLGRGHEEGSFDNGVCISIMRSGLGDCLDRYQSQSREYYLNELFLAQ